MYHILVVTHGTLADSLVETLELFVNDTGTVHPISLGEKSIYTFEEEVAQIIASINQPILAMVDLYQGSPFKACYMELINREGSKIISNLNFASLLVATLKCEVQTIAETVDEIIQNNQLIVSETTLQEIITEDDE